MTSDELLDSIRDYFEAEFPGQRTVNKEIASAQAYSWIMGLVFWMRERNELFLPTAPTLEVNQIVEKTKQS